MWGEYKLGDLFDIQNTLSFNTDKLTKGKEYDYITRTSLNQGILQTTGFVNKENINPAGTWSLGLLQMDFFYRNKPWYAGQFVRKIVPKIIIPDGAKLFFQTLLNLQKPKLLQVLVRNVDETFRNITIQLPQTEEKEIDYSFMENFVYEIEKSRLNKIETYFMASGLDDYNLTHNDISALNDFKKLQWQEFKIGDLYYKVELEKVKFNKRRDTRSEPSAEFSLPVINAKHGDNGIMFYGKESVFASENMTIDIVQNGAIATGDVYPQPQRTGILWDAYLIKAKKHPETRQTLFFLSCAIKKSIKPKFSYEVKATWDRVQREKIYLPVTADRQPDLMTMERLITAIQKIVIADVVKYTHRCLASAQQIVESTPIPYDTNDVSDYWLAAEPFECYKWNSFNQGITDFFGSDKTILVGCYKGKKHLDWILAHSIYNIRLGKTKGSMEEKCSLFGSASLLVLYEYGKPNKLSAYKIADHHEMSKEELLEMNYPKKNPRKNYMTFSITPIEMDLEPLVNQRFIEKLIEIDSSNAKGTPVFITP